MPIKWLQDKIEPLQKSGCSAWLIRMKIVSMLTELGYSLSVSTHVADCYMEDVQKNCVSGKYPQLVKAWISLPVEY